MPTPVEIVGGLARIANDWIAVAIAWHVALAGALVAFALGWRPGPRTSGLLIASLPSSVATAAFAAGNPFNGIVLATLAVVLAALALRDRGAPHAFPPSVRWAGAVVLAFGWLYPHFLHGSPLRYLYAAPVGLVPCPTLAVALGLALVVRGEATRAWSLVLAAVAAFYAVFGVIRLGVTLDVGLLVGAVLVGLSTIARVALAPLDTERVAGA